MQPPALFNTGHTFQPRLHARHHPAHRAGPVKHRRIYRQYRRGFGHTVAFKNTDAKFLHIDPARRLFNRLRTRQNIAQAPEIIRMCHAGIAAKEGVRAKQNRGICAINQFRNNPVMQRRRVHIHRNTGSQRQNQPNGEPERVKHRQNIENFVLPAEIDPRRRLRGVCEQIGVREHHAFRRPLGA